MPGSRNGLRVSLRSLPRTLRGSTRGHRPGASRCLCHQISTRILLMSESAAKALRMFGIPKNVDWLGSRRMMLQIEKTCRRWRVLHRADVVQPCSCISVQRATRNQRVVERAGCDEELRASSSAGTYRLCLWADRAPGIATSYLFRLNPVQALTTTPKEQHPSQLHNADAPCAI